MKLLLLFDALTYCMWFFFNIDEKESEALKHKSILIKRAFYSNEKNRNNILKQYALSEGGLVNGNYLNIFFYIAY